MELQLWSLQSAVELRSSNKRGEWASVQSNLVRRPESAKSASSATRDQVAS